jgi:rhodanese-related sulfurtransferase
MVATITPRELAARLAAEPGIELWDVRTPVEYQEVHVKGTKNRPLSDLDAAAARAAGVGTEQRPLYVVCRSGSRGKQACELLERAGVTNVINVEGGTLACAEAGLAVVRGRAMISLERQVRIAAGSLVLVGVGLGWFLAPYWLGLAAFVGAGLVFAGVTDTCGMGLLLARMPWNRVATRAASMGSSPGACATVSK